MKRPSVLVVDDERDFMESLVRRLILRGFQARGVDGGAQALAHMERMPAEVVVLDVKMPGMDGLEVLRRIKRDHPKTQVIVLTGHASLESGEEGMRLGAREYLIKPVPIKELIEKISAAGGEEA